MNKIVKNLNGDESALWGLEKDAEWRNAWSRLIAYAWMSEGNLVEAVSQPIPTMYKVSNYLPPAGLILRVCGTGQSSVLFSPEWPKVSQWRECHTDGNGELEAEATFTFHNQDELSARLNEYLYDATEITTGNNGWENLGKSLPTEIVLTIPPKPTDDNVQTFALADYQATGKTFPFTS